MGSGVSSEGKTFSTVSFAPSPDATDMQSKLRRLLHNKRQIDKVYKHIASIDKNRGKLGKSYDINYGELVTYFASKKESQKDNELQSLSAPKEVVKAAFNYVSGDPTQSVMSRKQFRVFLPTLFLFAELWKVFEIVDDNVNDRKLFFGEFDRAYKSFGDSSGQVQPIKNDSGLSGVKVDKSILTEEEWKSAFGVLDKDKSGYISFLEFCSYAAKNIISPMDFIGQDCAEEVVESSPSEDCGTEEEVVVTSMGFFKLSWSVESAHHWKYHALPNTATTMESITEPTAIPLIGDSTELSTDIASDSIPGPPSSVDETVK